MSDDEGFTEERPVDPDRLESRVGELPIVFRGVDQAAVEHLIRRSAAEIRRLRRELERAAVAPRADPADITEDMLTARLGEEAAMVLSAAREAAAQVRTKAEDNVARMIREAQDEIDELRAKTERERALILSRASDEADGIVGNAQRVQNEAVHRADAELASARAQSEEVLRITGEHRERVLAELGQLHGQLVTDIRSLDKQRTQMLDDLKVAQGRLGRTLGDLDKSHTLPTPLSLPAPPAIPGDAAAKLVPQPPRTPDKIVPPAKSSGRSEPVPDDHDLGPDDSADGGGDVGVDPPPTPDGSAPSGAAVDPTAISDVAIGDSVVGDPPPIPPVGERLFDTDVVPPANASAGQEPTSELGSSQAAIDLRDVPVSAGDPVAQPGSDPAPATSGALALHRADHATADSDDPAGSARRSRRRHRAGPDAPLPAGDVAQYRVDVGDDHESVRLLSSSSGDPDTGPIATVLEFTRGATEDSVLDDPVLDDPVLDDPVLDEAVLDDPVLGEAVLDDPVLDTPEPEVADEPVADPIEVAEAPEVPEAGPPVLGIDDLTAAFSGGGPLDPRPGEYVVDLEGGSAVEPQPDIEPELTAEPSTAPAAEASTAPAAEPPGEPDLVVDDDPADESDRASSLFAQLRASREAQVEDARRVLAADETVAAPDGEPELALDAGSEPEPEPGSEPEPEPTPVEVLFAGRDDVVERETTALVSQIKRVLADQQNELLDQLRRNDDISEVPTLAGSPTRLFANEAYPFLSRSAEAGALLVGTAPPIAVDDLAAGFADELATPLDARIERAVSEAGADAGRRLRAVFREFRSELLPALAEGFVSAAVARGVFTAIDPEGGVIWRCHPRQGCAEGADNELAGAVGRGEPFPTGHVEAPAYVGCRCLVVPSALAT